MRLQNNKLTKEKNNPFNKISKDILIYIPAFLIPAFINVFSLLVFTRLFDPGEYGVYSLVVTTTTFVAILFSEWITQSIQRYLPQNKTLEREVVFLSYLKILIVSLVVAFVFVAGLSYWHLKPQLNKFESFYWPASLLILLQILFAISGGVLQSQLKSSDFSLYRILNVTLRLLISLAWIYMFGREIIGLLWGAVITFCIILIPMLRKNGLLNRSGLLFREQLGDYKQYFLQFISYGFPMMGWYIGTSILDISDRYLLELLGSSKDVGIYSANYNLISASLGLVTAPLLTASQPVIMNMVNKVIDDLDKIKNLISNLSRIYLLVVMPFIIYVAVFREEITYLLLGEDFREGAAIIPILLIAFSCWNFSMYGQIGHMIREKTYVMLAYVFIAACFNILLNIILIPNHGYLGAALSTLISFLVYPVFIYFSSRKFIAWEIKWKSFIKIFLISSFIGFVMIHIRNYILVSLNPIFILLIGICIGISLYIVLLLAVKELNNKEIIFLRNILRLGYIAKKEKRKDNSNSK